MIADAPWVGLAGVAGLALGSFAVTSGLRISRGEGAVAGRSHCDACGQTLGFAQTLPLVSYLRLAGACSGCRAPIDPTHLVGEVAGAVVVISSFIVAVPERAILLSILGLTLIVATAVDWKTRRLPDALTVVIVLAAVGLAVLSGLSAVIEGIVAAAAVATVLLSLRWLAARRRGEPGLGLGDVKLMAALALWLGTATTWLVAGAALAGLAMMALVRPADGKLAFGPPIALAAWIIGLGREAGAWPTIM